MNSDIFEKTEQPSEKRNAHKKRRSSILKNSKPRIPLEELDNEDEIKPVRRVSFASINSVKPFVADPEKNTIWDSTYEEDVKHTPSTSECSQEHLSQLTSKMSSKLFEGSCNDNLAVTDCENMELTLVVDSARAVPIKFSIVEYANKVSQVSSKSSTNFLKENFESEPKLSNTTNCGRSINMELTLQQSKNETINRTSGSEVICSNIRNNELNSTLLNDKMELNCKTSKTESRVFSIWDDTAKEIAEVSKENITEHSICSNVEVPCQLLTPEDIDLSIAPQISHKNLNVQSFSVAKPTSSQEDACQVQISNLPGINNENIPFVCPSNKGNNNKSLLNTDMEFTCQLPTVSKENVSIQSFCGAIKQSSQNDNQSACPFQESNFSLKNTENTGLGCEINKNENEKSELSTDMEFTCNLPTTSQNVDVFTTHISEKSLNLQSFCGAVKQSFQNYNQDVCQVQESKFSLKNTDNTGLGCEMKKNEKTVLDTDMELTSQAQNINLTISQTSKKSLSLQSVSEVVPSTCQSNKDNNGKTAFIKNTEFTQLHSLRNTDLACTSLTKNLDANSTQSRNNVEDTMEFTCQLTKSTAGLFDKFKLGDSEMLTSNISVPNNDNIKVTSQITTETNVMKTDPPSAACQIPMESASVQFDNICNSVITPEMELTCNINKINSDTDMEFTCQLSKRDATKIGCENIAHMEKENTAPRSDDMESINDNIQLTNETLDNTVTKKIVNESRPILNFSKHQLSSLDISCARHIEKDWADSWTMSDHTKLCTNDLRKVEYLDTRSLIMSVEHISENSQNLENRVTMQEEENINMVPLLNSPNISNAIIQNDNNCQDVPMDVDISVPNNTINNHGNESTGLIDSHVSFKLPKRDKQMTFLNISDENEIMSFASRNMAFDSLSKLSTTNDKIQLPEVSISNLEIQVVNSTEVKDDLQLSVNKLKFDHSESVVSLREHNMDHFVKCLNVTTNKEPNTTLKLNEIDNDNDYQGLTFVKTTISNENTIEKHKYEISDCQVSKNMSGFSTSLTRKESGKSRIAIRTPEKFSSKFLKTNDHSKVKIALENEKYAQSADDCTNSSFRISFGNVSSEEVDDTAHLLEYPYSHSTNLSANETLTQLPYEEGREKLLDDISDTSLVATSYIEEEKENHTSKSRFITFELPHRDYSVIPHENEIESILEKIEKDKNYIENYLENFKVRQIPVQLGFFMQAPSAKKEKQKEEIVKIAIEDQIKHHEFKCQKYWKLISIDRDNFHFSTLFGAVLLNVKLDRDSGSVLNIEINNKLSVRSSPLAHFLTNTLLDKLRVEHIKSAIGDNYDILSLLDYVRITLIKLREFQKVFERCYLFQLEADFRIKCKIMCVQSMLHCDIFFNIAKIDDFNVNKDLKIINHSNINENQIKQLAKNCGRNLQFLVNFHEALVKFKANNKKE